MSVRAGIDRDLVAAEERMPGISQSGLAMAARELADRMDDPETSATAVSNCAGKLLETMDRIFTMLPPEEVPDGVTRLNEARERRLAG